MSTSPTAQLSIGVELESFLYTPYGVSTLAAVAVLLTSFVWCLGCSVYCCHQRRQRQNQEGVLEANRELDYYGVEQSGLTNPLHRDGTMSSGYNTAPTLYSLDTPTGTTNKATFTTSLDSIIDREV